MTGLYDRALYFILSIPYLYCSSHESLCLVILFVILMVSYMVPTRSFIYHPSHLLQSCIEDSELLPSNYLGIHRYESSLLGHNDSTCITKQSCLPPRLVTFLMGQVK